MNKIKALSRYSAAITFLAFEFFTLMAFNFSGSFVLFGALSLALTVLLVIFNIAEIKLKGLSNVALFFIPLFMFVLLTALGQYNIAHTKINDFSWAETVFIPLGILPMAFNGYLLSLDKNFKIKTFITVIYSALAVYVAINFIYNIINFGAFYPVIYKGYYLYYSGMKSQLPVNEFAYVLEGFKFIEVKMAHYVLYPLLLLSSAVMLIFTSPRKEKKTFILHSAFVLLALLSLVLIPSLLSLLGIAVTAILLLLIWFCKRFLGARKVFKIILIVLVVLFILFYAFYVIAVSTGLSNSFTGILDRLFNSNRFAREYQPILVNLFSSSKFLGFAVNEVATGIYEEVYLSGAFIFDTFMTSGVLGAIAIFIFIFLGFKSFKKYFHLHSDEFRFQATLLLFVILFVGYSALFNTGDYALYYRIYKPIYLTAPFMLMVFIFSYVIAKGHINDGVKQQKFEEVTVNE